VLCGYLLLVARGQSKEQARRAFEEAEILFRDTYKKLLQQPQSAGTFHPTQPGRHKELAGGTQLPRHQLLQPTTHAGELEPA
jgi:hypothetical protein